MQQKVKNQILELRNKGYSYDYISKKLNCSKGTICYHCGEGQKNKVRLRQLKNRGLKNPLHNKIQVFLYKKYKNKNKIRKNKTSIYNILNKKITTFHKIYNGRKCIKKEKFMFTEKELLKKIGENPKCYLTGKSIDLLDSKSYQLDHIIPRSKGGPNSLDNCQIACKEANYAKGNLMLDEFFELCKSVLKYNKIG
jgi:5-methylcytosine-specific restriction endonuclease McrA